MKPKDFTPQTNGYKDNLPLFTPKKIKNLNREIVALEEITEKLHINLPITRVWRYNKTIPVFEVEKGSKVFVDWENKIKPTNTRNTLLPFKTGTTRKDINITKPGNDGDFKDRSGLAVDEMGYGSAIRTVTHLHGAIVGSDSDGWTDNTSLFGQIQHCVYTNKQNATMLWFHDHAMGVTRLNVYAGLAGIWIIRDAIEKKLNLPRGEQELILVIQDRNLDTNPDGTLSGDTLHKVSEKIDRNGGIMEFFGPYNTINGKIWPNHKVNKQQYRIRMVNGSNARSYQLAWLNGMNEPIEGLKIFKIGTDQGLLEKSIEIDTEKLTEGLTIAAGERLDLIVDFSEVTEPYIFLKNIAYAPWDGKSALSKKDLDKYASDDIMDKPRDEKIVNDSKNRFPEMMRFDIIGEPASKNYVPIKKGSNLGKFTQITDHDQLYKNHEHRFIMLTEEDDPANYATRLLLHELVEKTAATASQPTVCQIIDLDENKKTRVREFYSGASGFYDTVNFQCLLSTKATQNKPTELWRIINNTGDAHPFHIHLGQSQVFRRQWINVKSAGGVPGDPLTVDLRNAGPNKIEDKDLGPKDTVVVNGNSETGLEVLTLVVHFKEYAGRYMYHCHIMEHEDHEMMRPIVVTTDPMAMNMGGMAM